MHVNRPKVPEINESLFRQDVTSNIRRKTIHVTQRGQTALGILRVPGASLRAPALLPKRKSSTAASTFRRASTNNFEMTNQDSAFLNARRVSYSDVTTRLSTIPNSPSLRKSSSESDAFLSVVRKVERRGSLQVKHCYNKSTSRFGSRRQSRVPSIPENAPRKKVQKGDRNSFDYQNNVVAWTFQYIRAILPLFIL